MFLSKGEVEGRLAAAQVVTNLASYGLGVEVFNDINCLGVAEGYEVDGIDLHSSSVVLISCSVLDFCDFIFTSL